MKTSARPFLASKTTQSKRRRIARAPEPAPGADVIEMVPLMLGLKHILVPVDFSRTSLEALRYAVPLAKQFAAKLTLLHVVAIPASAAELGYLAVGGVDGRVVARRRLGELARRAVPSEVKVETLVGYGTSYDIIAKLAEKLGVDLVVITTHGFTGLKRVLLGGTAERVVRHTHCPVLVVR